MDSSVRDLRSTGVFCTSSAASVRGVLDVDDFDLDNPAVCGSFIFLLDEAVEDLILTVFTGNGVLKLSSCSSCFRGGEDGPTDVCSLSSVNSVLWCTVPPPTLEMFAFASLILPEDGVTVDISPHAIKEVSPDVMSVGESAGNR